CGRDHSGNYDFW
nr:immunoglobulin heavy chain junction region [Macaca mulatta]